jgi:hypothetical protein
MDPKDDDVIHPCGDDFDGETGPGDEDGDND